MALLLLLWNWCNFKDDIIIIYGYLDTCYEVENIASSEPVEVIIPSVGRGFDNVDVSVQSTGLWGNGNLIYPWNDSFL